MSNSPPAAGAQAISGINNDMINTDINAFFISITSYQYSDFLFCSSV
jgi:hypothetical protein